MRPFSKVGPRENSHPCLDEKLSSGSKKICLVAEGVENIVTLSFKIDTSTTSPSFFCNLLLNFNASLLNSIECPKNGKPLSIGAFITI